MLFFKTSLLYKNIHTKDILFLIILLFTCICTFVPFFPWMPEDGVDPSWVMAMNEFIAKKLRFGKDIIFTYGPYACIRTEMYHPATDTMMLFGSSYIAISFAFLIFYVFKNSGYYLKIIILAIIPSILCQISLNPTKDAFYFFYPFLTSIAYLKFYEKSKAVYFNKKISFLIFLFFPFGIIGLIKANYLFLCVAITCILSIYLSIKKDYKSALTIIFISLFSVLFFWILAGQKLCDLPLYLFCIFDVSLGYSDLSENVGKSSDIFLYLLCVACLCYSILSQLNKKTCLIVSLFTITAFFSFKEAFVRHDSGHVCEGAFIILSAILIKAIFSSKRATASLWLSLLIGFYITNQCISVKPKNLLQQIKTTYFRSIKGLKIRIKDRKKLDNMFDNAISEIRERYKIPKLNGTTDIYPNDLACIICSFNTWNPRPMCQSYTAFTPLMLNANKNHLLKNNAPDNIIFKTVPKIDHLTIPLALNDGCSFPTILAKYHPILIKDDCVYLEKNRYIKKVNEHILLKCEKQLNQEINVTKSKQFVFAKIKLRKTLLGHLSSMLFKASQLEIYLKFVDGTSAVHRIIPGMIETGFLLSPFVDNANEFNLMYKEEKYLFHKKVQSFYIKSKGPEAHWKRNFDVEFIELDIEQ